MNRVFMMMLLSNCTSIMATHIFAATWRQRGAVDTLDGVDAHSLFVFFERRKAPASDFLEIACAQAVQRRTIDAVRKHKSSPMGRRGEILPDATDEDGDEIERPIELAADDAPGPEAILLELRDEERRRELFSKACQAVKDPRHLEAAILHFCEGWPIVTRDPDKADLARHFHATEGQIKHWIAAALKAMRRVSASAIARSLNRAFGVSKFGVQK